MLQRQVVVCGDRATVLTNERDRERKEVVREHQWHNTSTSEALVRMGRLCVTLAMCARWRRHRSAVAWSHQLIFGGTSSGSRVNTGTKGSRRVSSRLELSENQP